MEMSFFSQGMEQHQQIETDHIPVNAVAQTTSSDNLPRHRWHSLIRVKNKWNTLGKGMYSSFRLQ
jgi:hypothetical protein